MPELTPAKIRRMPDEALEALLGTDLSEDEMEAIEDELEARDEYRAEHADSPSLQDYGNELGSYGS